MTDSLAVAPAETPAPRVEIIINHIRHHFDIVELIGKQGTKVELDGDNIVPEYEYPVILSPDSARYTGKAIIVYQYQGKWAVILGREILEQKMAAAKRPIEGRIITSFSLKRARIESDDPRRAMHHQPAQENAESARGYDRGNGRARTEDRARYQSENKPSGRPAFNPPRVVSGRKREGDPFEAPGGLRSPYGQRRSREQ